MHFLDLTLPTLAENFGLDEALLQEADAGRGGEVLRVWELPFLAVVLGAAGVIADDVEMKACSRDGIPIGRRTSGGGTVLLGPGCLVISLVLSLEQRPELAGVRASYSHILGRIGFAVGATFAGSSDLTVHDRKVSGNSQRRGRKFVLHHGTVLYGFDLAQIPKYLKPPPRQPAYRRQRAHADFVMNLAAGRAEIVDVLRRLWRADEATVGWPEAVVGELVASKFGQKEWVNRR